MTRSRLALAAATLLFGTSACVLDDVAVEEPGVFACASDDDCLDDLECLDGLCQVPVTLCADNDSDGFPAGPDCVGDALDCDDTDDTIFPGATEVCNGLDDNCDGTEDEGVGVVPCELIEGVCEGATTMCAGGVPDCAASCPGPDCPYGADFVSEEGVDESSDGLDNDCDGVPDENKPACTDGSPCNENGCGAAVEESACACKVGMRRCSDNACVDANGDEVLFSFNGMPEMPGNGIDDNCDGLVE